MKKILLTILCFTFFVFLHAQNDTVSTHTIKDSYLLYGFNGSSYTKYIKVPANTNVFILGLSPVVNTIDVLYNDSIYGVHKSYLPNNIIDIAQTIEQAKNKSIPNVEESHKEGYIERIMRNFETSNGRNKHEKDSICFATAYPASWDRFLHTSEFTKLSKKNPIAISYIETSHPNSAGRIDLHFKFLNLSKKTIKYIYLSGYPLNSVGDRAYCEVKKHSNVTLTGVGPIEFSKVANYSFERTWWNGTIKTFVPTSIKIQYTDRSVSTMNRQKIKESMKYASFVDNVNIKGINLASLPYGKFTLSGTGLYSDNLSDINYSLSNSYIELSDKNLKIENEGKIQYDLQLSNPIKTNTYYSLYDLKKDKNISVIAFDHKSPTGETLYSLTFLSGNDTQAQVFVFPLSSLVE